MEEAKKAPEDTLQDVKAKCTQKVPSAFDEYLTGKLLLGYIEPLMDIDYRSSWFVLKGSQSACFHELGFTEQYERVNPLLHVLIILYLHRANIF